MKNKTKQTVLLFGGLLLLPILASIFIFAPKASAATITVTTTADRNTNPGTGCSFYEAVQAANNDAAYAGCAAGSGADTINLPAGTYSIVNNTPSINESLTILGDSAGGTVIDGSVLQFYPLSDNQVYLTQDITVQNSNSYGVSFNGNQNDDYSATFNRITIKDNDNHGFYHERVGFYRGKIYINDSVIKDNAGTGLYNYECQTAGTVYVSNSMISGNQDGGIYNECGHIELNKVTISHNVKSGNGAGILSRGQINLTNVTIFNNYAGGDGGGVMLEEDITGFNYDQSSFTNVTIANNKALNDGGIGELSFYAPLLVTNTLVSGNQYDQCTPGVSFAVGSTNNMATDDSCGDDNGFSQTADAKLASSLSDNGGSAPIGSGGLGGNLLTLALLEGSPAINGGDNDNCPAVDERNLGRPFGGVTCDIGAYEANFNPSAPITPGSGAGSVDSSLADTGQAKSLVTLVGIAVVSFAMLVNHITIKKRRQI